MKPNEQIKCVIKPVVHSHPENDRVVWSVGLYCPGVTITRSSQDNISSYFSARLGESDVTVIHDYFEYSCHRNARVCGGEILEALLSDAADGSLAYAEFADMHGFPTFDDDDARVGDVKEGMNIHKKCVEAFEVLSGLFGEKNLERMHSDPQLADRVFRMYVAFYADTPESMGAQTKLEHPHKEEAE